jgi:hypothetical protein
MQQKCKGQFFIWFAPRSLVHYVCRQSEYEILSLGTKFIPGYNIKTRVLISLSGIKLHAGTLVFR